MLATRPVKYAGFIIAPRRRGYDLIDPTTGAWAYYPSQRYARWSATFLRNTALRFGKETPLSVLPEITPMNEEVFIRGQKVSGLPDSILFKQVAALALQHKLLTGLTYGAYESKKLMAEVTSLNNHLKELLNYVESRP